jgi:hypothetical protein
MAGFEVSINGRFWVSTEAKLEANWRRMKSGEALERIEPLE